MIAKTVAALAIIGSASAYVPPMMSLSANRREVVAGAAAATVAAPLLRPSAADAKITYGDIKAPVIVIFDARGCEDHVNREYKGVRAGNENDEQCVKLTMENIKVDEGVAKDVLRASLSTMRR